MLPEKDVFLFDFNRNYASILYPFRVIVLFSSKVANFNSPHLHIIQFEFCRDLWHQKLESLGYRAELFAHTYSRLDTIEGSELCRADFAVCVPSVCGTSKFGMLIVWVGGSGRGNP